MTCGSQAFIGTLIVDPSMSALSILASAGIPGHPFLCVSRLKGLSLICMKTRSTCAP
jgi:hypothetical protein